MKSIVRLFALIIAYPSMIGLGTWIAFAADPPVSSTFPACYYTANPSTLPSGTAGYILCDAFHRIILSGGVGGLPTQADPPISDTLKGCYYAAAPSTLTEGSVGYWLCDSTHHLQVH